MTFLSMAPWIASSGTVKGSQQGGSFHLSYNLISLCHATKACGVFSNMVSPHSGGQLRAIQ